ncbi:hypothetical protein AVEN_156900-1 [Araneus ventricosus]|uniref:Retrovirus-related Pol polyprotein from transposon TNT 1-94-like beta-barrel domain-containing protein n=1 Tax=Araneus ventricosus TaxID=182803 RepID=A0A4Y2EPE3_ARAVE|nr:hypothetical protein AVEN_156900-1 [Araneus ventricosus]
MVEFGGCCAVLIVVGGEVDVVVIRCFAQSGGSDVGRFLFRFDVEINPIDDTNIKLAVHKTVEATSKGIVTFDVLVRNQTKEITLQNVLYIPDLNNNLISISNVATHNFTVKLQRNHASVINFKNEIVLMAKREKVLYYVTAIVESVSIVKEVEQWHQKFGHLNEKDLKK